MEIIIKVLHICSYYYGTKLYKNLMEKLIKNGIDTDVYAPCDYKYNYDGDEKFLIQEKCFNKIDRFLFYYKYKKIYNMLNKKTKVQKYDLLHAHSLFSNGYIAYKTFKQHNIPYIVAVRNTDINVFFKYIFYLRKLGIEILENASKIVFISNAYIDKLSKYIPKEKRQEIESKYIVLPNGIDESFFKTESTSKKLEKGKLNLVYTGRIDKNKNLITTIKCCDEILKQKYSIKLTVIGTITSKRYKKIIEKYSFIDYVGRKDKEEIVKIYKNMDIFVMPSKHETFGLTYVEAMSQGLPVIYTRNEGFDKFFEEGAVGYSIKYNDHKEMAQKIDLIVNNYQTISKNSIKNASKFDWEDIALKYIEEYKKIIKK